MSRIRRLHFEASTLVVAHLKAQVTPDQGIEAVKKIPAAEKQARLVAQQARLTGLQIVGELQPSHSLVDLVASMIESKVLCGFRHPNVRVGIRKCRILASKNLRLCPLNNRL